MSTLKKKKAIINMIQKQEKKMKDISIPKILPGKLNDKNQVERNKSYDKLHEFLTQVINLTDDDLLLPSNNSYDNPIIQEGYDYFLKEEKVNKIRALIEEKDLSDEDYEKVDKESIEEWKESPKLFYILKKILSIFF